MPSTSFLTTALLAARAVSGTIIETRFANTTWDTEAWTLNTSLLTGLNTYQTRPSIANGYIGLSTSLLGPFFEVDLPPPNASVPGSESTDNSTAGWPLFTPRQAFGTVAGFWDAQPELAGTNFPWLYQYGYESVIAGLPHWSGLAVLWGNETLGRGTNESAVREWQSSLNVREGRLSWAFEWWPTGAQDGLQVRYDMFLHKLLVNRAVIRLELSTLGQTDVNVTVADVLDGQAAVRTNTVGTGLDGNSSIWSAVSPWGVSTVETYVYSTLAGADLDWSTRRQLSEGPFSSANDSSIAQGVDVVLTPGKTAVVEKYIGIASTDAFEDPQKTAKNASLGGAQDGWDQLLESHVQEWASILTPDSVDDYSLPDGSLPDDEYLQEQQVLAVTNPYYLLQNIVGTNAIAAAGNNTKLDLHGISVCGLVSDCYAGMVFWDMDVWMAPGLVVAHPQAGKQIANYRVDKYPQAKKNAQTAYQSSQNHTTFSDNAAIYSWTSGRYGNCTASGPCFDYEYHLNGDIGLQLFNYYAATGDSETFRDELWPVYDSIATLYSELLEYNSTTDTYHLKNATDPDEYANHVDDPGYTMALIKTHLETANVFRSRFGVPTNETWATQASKVDIPVNQNADIILEYDTMNGSISVKQADVVLVDDILDYPNSYSLSDLDYYANRQSVNGPGMTYGVFSIVANEVSPSGCSAYTYALYGSSPYIRGPWFHFSEQLLDNYTINGGTHPAFPFLTGIGGAHRVSVYGYLGLRLLLDSFNIDPALPPQIPQLRYRNLYYQGHAIAAWSNQTHTTISRLPANYSLANANATFLDSAIPVTIGQDRDTTYPLPPNGTLVLPNRQYSHNLTWPGNLAQCLSAASAQPFQPGQFPSAAVDGATSTVWQPTDPDILSWLVVQTGYNRTTAAQTFTEVTQLRLDWASHPPAFFTVLFTNATTPPDPAALPTSFAALDAFAPETVADGDAVRNVSTVPRVAVSRPWNASAAAEIATYVGNSTTVTLDPGVWSGRYAVLGVFGNQGGAQSGVSTRNGATVAEFGVLTE